VTPTGPGSDFEAAVIRVLRSLRRGDVVTYGEVATEAAYPGLSRAVGALLARNDDPNLPWWRVVNAAGRLVPEHEAEQGRRLRAEGVEVDLAAGRVRRTGPRARNEPPAAPTARQRGWVR
jgi:methylated-DNA-protein-cysteine methyltransferase-like protein